MRIDSEDLVLKTSRLATAIERYGAELFGRYMVIEDRRLRSRPL
jgi:hypothetical protein